MNTVKYKTCIYPITIGALFLAGLMQAAENTATPNLFGALGGLLQQQLSKKDDAPTSVPAATGSEQLAAVDARLKRIEEHLNLSPMTQEAAVVPPVSPTQITPPVPVAPSSAMTAPTPQTSVPTAPAPALTSGGTTTMPVTPVSTAPTVPSAPTSSTSTQPVVPATTPTQTGGITLPPPPTSGTGTGAPTMPPPPAY